MVDIVIPIKQEDNYYWALLGRAVRSVLKQSYTEYRLIIQVYDKEVADGRNLGLEQGFSPYCLTLDADDWLEPDFLAKTVPLMTGFDIVATGAKFTNGSYFKPSPTGFEDTNQILNCSLFKREILDFVSFDNKLPGLEDYKFWLEATRCGYTVGTLDEPLVNISDIQGSRNKTFNHQELYKQIKCQS